jgi:hypothetical protein
VNGDSYVNVTSTGTLNGFDPAGRICANFYAFDPSEELVACCSCAVTTGRAQIDVGRAGSHQQHADSWRSVVIKLIGSAAVGGTCNPSAPGVPSLSGGMRAWATSLHQNTASGKFEMTENVFQNSPLSDSEFAKLTTYRGFIQANGSGFGICKSCRVGGLGGASQ